MAPRYHRARAAVLEERAPWTDRERRLARRMLTHAEHVGHVAEKLGRTVMDVATELELGDVRVVASSARWR